MTPAHCNGRRCVESSVYHGDSRECRCTCDGCIAASRVATSEPSPARPSVSAKRHLQITTSQGLLIAGAMVLAYFGIARACSTERAASTVAQTPVAPVATKDEPAATAVYAEPSPAHPEPVQASPADTDDEWTIEDAILWARPKMTDTSDGKVSPGATALASRILARMPPWAELMAVPATDPKKVMKDSTSERGKRICVSGSLIEIAVEQTKNGASIAEGGIATDAGDTVRFAAIGATGELVAHSYARFCGITTGRQSYETTAHEIRHAVYVVGMFDLPANHIVAKPKPKPAPPPSVEPKFGDPAKSQ